MFSGVYMILHVATQLAHGWFDPREVMSAPEHLARPESLRLVDWQSAIHSLQHHRLHQWLQRRRLRENGVEMRLAASIINHVKLVHANKARYITLLDPLYPPLLRNIAKPPLAITMMGESELLEKPMNAVVGSRKASEKAVRESAVLAMGFADAGYVIVSGGALGCDTAAHWGALQSGYVPTPTVVVFSSGLMHLHPQQNDYLFRCIRDNQGVFLSERLWWQHSLGRDFPIRNRIITGLASRLYIMQAAERSGAMVTARCALEQNRDVYVMRHDSEDVRALGSQRLIDDGAQPFDDAMDALHDFSDKRIHLF